MIQGLFFNGSPAGSSRCRLAAGYSRVHLALHVGPRLACRLIGRRIIQFAFALMRPSASAGAEGYIVSRSPPRTRQIKEG